MNYHNVVIARNGSFVGLYRKDKVSNCWRLWRCITPMRSRCGVLCYGFTTSIHRTPELNWRGYSNHFRRGAFDEWECNEMHKIPKHYNVHDMHHLKYLDSLLGGSHFDVRKKIVNGRPDFRGGLEVER